MPDAADTVPALPVPDEAVTKLYTAIGWTGPDWEHPATVEAAVRAIAAPVVAAELRRWSEIYAGLAAAHDDYDPGMAAEYRNIARDLTGRADKLEQARTETS